VSPLADYLRRRIKAEGPLTVAQYMQQALCHSEHGYYMFRDPLGAAGDFTTAPEISQMFGEIIGIWCAALWREMGSPERVNLVELGPGRGTLMADALRAAAAVPGFAAAIDLHMVETSPFLRRRQRQSLSTLAADRRALWHDDFSRVPTGPLLLIANEFFDALPVRQFQRTAAGWRERLVALEGEEFRFVLSPPWEETPPIPRQLAASPVGALVEVRPAAAELAFAIAQRVRDCGGAALIVDYGHGQHAVGDTLQAVKGHRYHDVLAMPGEADLTAHVDFLALARAAGEAGVVVFGPVPQGEFLGHLGLGVRAEALALRASPEQANDIAQTRKRLLGEEGMGRLFKALAIVPPGAAIPPGFE
jgi:SAM-dependent MidA family methyltransferase